VAASSPPGCSAAILIARKVHVGLNMTVMSLFPGRPQRGSDRQQDLRSNRLTFISRIKTQQDQACLVATSTTGCPRLAGSRSEVSPGALAGSLRLLVCVKIFLNLPGEFLRET